MTKKYVLLLLVFFSAVLFAISGKYTGSTTNAAYKTIIDGSSSARVARWEIGEIEKAGAGVTMAAGMAKLESGDSGNWFFEVANNSETIAKIEEDVKITVKLVSEVFSTNAYNNLDTYTWDYIKSNGDLKENPITFKVYIYDATSFESLVRYSKGINELNYAQYMALSEQEKAGYTEIVISDIDPVIDTSKTSGQQSITNLKLSAEIEDDKLVHYLSQTITINKELFSSFGLGDSSKPKVFRIEWDISDEISSGSGEEKKYRVYTVLGKNDKQSVFVEYELFEYLKYLSSIKGEPSFIFPSSTGGQVEIKASKLTAEQRASLEPFEEENILEWERFKTDYAKYLESLGYLESGLSCSFIFDIKVSQGE